MPRRVILVHGAGVRNDRTRLWNLAPILARGFRVKRFCYGYVGLVYGQFSRTSKAAERLSNMLSDRDIVVAHSHGNVVAERAVTRAQGLRLVCLSPALDSGHRFSRVWDRVDVFYNPGDKFSWWAEHVPWHPWGAMLATGIMGRELEKREHNLSFQEFTAKNVDVEHGKYLMRPDVYDFGERLLEWLNS